MEIFLSPMGRKSNLNVGYDAVPRGSRLSMVKSFSQPTHSMLSTSGGRALDLLFRRLLPQHSAGRKAGSLGHIPWREAGRVVPAVFGDLPRGVAPATQPDCYHQDPEEERRRREWNSCGAAPADQHCCTVPRLGFPLYSRTRQVAG